MLSEAQSADHGFALNLQGFGNRRILYWLLRKIISGVANSHDPDNKKKPALLHPKGLCCCIWEASLAHVHSQCLAGMYFLSVAQSLNLAVKLFQLSEGQKFIQLILIPINIQANYFIELQSVNTLLRLLLLCRRTHLSVKSGIRDLEAGNTIDANVEDRYKDERDK